MGQFEDAWHVGEQAGRNLRSGPYKKVFKYKKKGIKLQSNSHNQSRLC
jgi:hypothetical protein